METDRSSAGGAGRPKAPDQPPKGHDTHGADDPHPPRVRHSFLKILTGSDLSRRRLPLMTAQSGRPGPVVWLTACGHGDEVGGMVVVQEIFKRLARRPLLKGALHAFPLMNPIGFETGSRHITLSHEDLNRSFPGDANGSVAERIAAVIFTTITRTRPALVLDLHNDWIRSIPYTLLDPLAGRDDAKAYETVERLSAATGFVVIRDTEQLHRTLSLSLLGSGIPAVTLELGESYVVNEKNIAYGVGAITNVLADLGLVQAPAEPFTYPLPAACRGRILRYCDRPFSSTSGIIRFLARPGDLVQKGQPVARVYNAFGRLQETLTAPGRGLILGHRDSSAVFPGVPVIACGRM